MSKKGTKAQPKEQSYDLRDVVLAKVRGYPPWPGMIVDPDSVPSNVQSERPSAAKSKKGNWYCVRFFPTGDYAWMVPKDISKLQQHEIQAYINEPFKRSGDLLQGYRIALDPTKWEEEREAARVEAAEEEANAEIDQLESDAEEDGEDGEEKKSKSRKRKRESDAAPAKSKAKAKTKSKKGSAEPAPKKRAGSAAKGKKNGAKSKTLVESEDEGGAEPEDEDAGPSKQTSPPPTKKAKRDKEAEDEADAAMANDPEASKVRDWRHKLQKAFLNNKVTPKDEDMPALDQLFSTVENYDKMTIQYLSFSKIGKVMRHIHVLTPDKVPRDDEFKFRERAKALVDRWHDVLAANKTNGADAAKATTNGTSPSAKAADAEDSGTTTNGKQDSEEPAKLQRGDSLMDLDADAKAEETTEDAPAEPEVEMNGDAPADVPVDGAADESTLADVTMSEIAA
ncbi:hypothetical protein B0H21DRAFT_165654 [Amylocystis lapponica]|nr:hypothetical protein B0H21DRAFT_165654 [Amylocystis lapponica]